MTAYYQLFLEQGQIPAIAALCKWADEQESALEKVRVRLGFQEDWSPYYDRQQSAPMRADISWGAKFMATQGSAGNLNVLLGELCGAADMLTEKWAEVNSIVSAKSVGRGSEEADSGRSVTSRPAPHVVEKRGPGRPPKRV